MFVPLRNNRNVMIGGAIPPLRKNPQDNIMNASEGKKGGNQIVGVHSPAPENKVLHGGELLDKIKFDENKHNNKRENIRFLF